MNNRYGTKGFLDCIDQFVDNRIENINNEIAQKEWYMELQDMLISLQNEYPPETKKIIFRNDEINNEILVRTMEELYREAFVDGIKAAAIMAPILAPER